jgi:PAS domain S-box-containing protein
VVGWVAAITDITERKRAEPRLEVQYAVSRVLAESPTLPDATPRIIQAICEHAGWDTGAIWEVDRGGNCLRCVEFWHRHSVAIQAFEAETRRRTFAPGIGLPGRVWSSGKSAWISDDTKDDNFPRASVALQDGLHAGVCFPITLGGSVLGVLECFSREIREPDEAFLQMLTSIGSQLGQFLERKRAEEELRESEERFHTMADAAPVLVWMSGTDKRCTYFNKRWLDFTGRTLEQEMGDGWAEGVHSDDMERCLDTYVRSFDARQEFEMEYRLRRYDGEHRWILDHGVPLFASPGQFVGYIGSCIDITERKQAAEQLEQRVQERTAELRRAHAALAENEQRLRSILDHSPAVIFLKDMQGHYLEVNRQFEQLFGLARHQVLGKTDDEIFPQAQAAAFRANDAEVLRAGRAIAFEEAALYLDGPHTNIVSKFPLRNAQGVIFAIGGIATDITERREREAMLTMLFDQSPDAIVVADASERIVRVNKQEEALFGYAAEELVGQPIDVLMPERFVGLHCRRYGEYFTAPRVRLMGSATELYGRRKDGSEFPVDIMLGPLHAPGGVMVMAVIRDITERKRLVNEIVEISERERQRFGQELHDALGQILTGVTFMSVGLEQQLRKQARPEAATAARIAKRIIQAQHSAHNLATELFPTELKRQGMIGALRQLVSDIEEMFEISGRFESNRRAVRLTDDLTALHLFRIAQEAVSNAVKHGKCKHLSVTLTASNEAITLRVHNDGVGMRAPALQRGDMGLGIMQHRASRIGATLDLQSVPGKGTTVICSLKVANSVKTKRRNR